MKTATVDQQVLTVIVLAVLTVGYVLVMFVDRAAKIRAKLSVPIGDQFEPAGVHELPAEDRRAFADAAAAWADAGYGPPAVRRVVVTAVPVRAVSAVAVHPAVHDVVAVSVWRVGDWRTIQRAAESVYADGARIVTKVMAEAADDMRWPGADVVEVPWVRDWATLLEAHRRHVLHAGRSGEPCATIDADRTDEYLSAGSDQTWERMIRRGVCRRDVAAGQYVCTWRGAFTLMWKRTQWVRAGRAKRRDRRARAAWAAWGMDDWHGPAEPPAASGSWT